MRAAGLNAIQFVIQWNLHEPTPGNYNFEGNLDVEAFIEMAQVSNISGLNLFLLIAFLFVVSKILISSFGIR